MLILSLDSVLFLWYASLLHSFHFKRFQGEFAIVFLESCPKILAKKEHMCYSVKRTNVLRSARDAGKRKKDAAKSGIFDKGPGHVPGGETEYTDGRGQV
jgi:hypothetical protein